MTERTPRDLLLPPFTAPRVDLRIAPLSRVTHHSSPHVMSQQSQNIQTLLDAEKEAAKLVQQARQYRTQRLKDARTEADKEIAEYRKQMDAEYKKFEAERSGSTQSVQSGIDKETEQRISSINDAFEKNRRDVVKKLLERVVEVHPEMHRNIHKV
ncbi:V-type ATPase [Dacryopinax primogenitus]|uniref:V-type proton ATPase subunit G n=1 Tax=Dacryopinax primogenitus (strain DJM 731) TaxID=1858805 RepID=M5GEX3_DACPD|nr:V-type ATPase [Dacryopinax primogenitus]EJU03653.1 V-type ATPase [Dacryopinax primogenitus]